MRFMGLFFPSRVVCDSASVFCFVNSARVLRWMPRFLCFHSQSCYSGRERRQLCLQLKSWHTHSRIYYSYHSVSERDLGPPVYLTNSPFCELSRSEQIMLTLMNWVFMSDAKRAFSQSHQAASDSGPRRSHREEQNVGISKPIRRRSIRYNIWHLP